MFLLQRYKNGAEKCSKNDVRFDFSDDSTLANQKIGKTIEKPLKELPWNQQNTSLRRDADFIKHIAGSEWPRREVTKDSLKAILLVDLTTVI